jgi:hypothetical protein
MDIGSFIVEADGVRWCDDLGAEYEIYDRRDGWATDQQSKRWTYFRVNNFSHNTLTLGNNIQQVKGMNPVIASKQDESGTFAVLDMSSAYQGQAKQIQRGIAVLPDKTMLVQDDYQAIDPTMDLRWNMMTQTGITLSEDGKTAQLEKGGQTMFVNILQPSSAQFIITDATPPTQVENPNTGFKRLSLILPAPVADGSLTVQFVPGSAKPASLPKHKAISDWCE